MFYIFQILFNRLHSIYSKYFQLVLDEHEISDLSGRGKYLLHGDGKTLWFDKSFCVVSFADGKIGINAEHSWGDAPVIGHMIEYTVVEE